MCTSSVRFESSRNWRLNSISALKKTGLGWGVPAPDPESFAERQRLQAELDALQGRERAVQARYERRRLALETRVLRQLRENVILDQHDTLLEVASTLGPMRLRQVLQRMVPLDVANPFWTRHRLSDHVEDRILLAEAVENQMYLIDFPAQSA